MLNQDLQSENQHTRFKEFFEFTGPIHRPRRKSFLIALELFAIFAFCVIFWQAGFGSLAEAVEIFFGLYFAEFCSGAINGNSLSKNIFYELPKFLYSHISRHQENSNIQEKAKLINPSEISLTYKTIGKDIGASQQIPKQSIEPEDNSTSLKTLSISRDETIIPFNAEKTIETSDSTTCCRVI